ncbi:MAG: recombinase family protein [Terriglobia bacterium]|jgi:predicted site-specific integrase-resolvase
MKKAAIYARVSTPDQRVENQLYQLRELAARRGFEVVHEYKDIGVSGSKARRGACRGDFTGMDQTSTLNFSLEAMARTRSTDLR